MRVLVSLTAMASVLLLLVGCASEFEKRYAEAERMRMLAAEAGVEWLQTEELISEAKLAATRGDTEHANSLLELAQFQAETAIEQGQHEANAWPGRVVQ